MFRNAFRSASTKTLIASAATAAFTGSSYISSPANANARCDSAPPSKDVPVFKIWRKRSDGTEDGEQNIALKTTCFSFHLSILYFILTLQSSPSFDVFPPFQVVSSVEFIILHPTKTEMLFGHPQLVKGQSEMIPKSLPNQEVDTF